MTHVLAYPVVTDILATQLAQYGLERPKQLFGLIRVGLAIKAVLAQSGQETAAEESFRVKEVREVMAIPSTGFCNW